LCQLDGDTRRELIDAIAIAADSTRPSGLIISATTAIRTNISEKAVQPL
jgi:hypothetical protein